MDAVAHKDYDDFVVGVCPGASAGESCVSVCALACRWCHKIVGCHIETKSTGGVGLLGGEFVNSLFAQVTVTAIRAAIEHHLEEDSDVVSRRK